jgi:MFS family permease
MSMADASTWLAFIYGGGGLLGVLVGGHIADTAARRTDDKRWFAWLPAVTTVAILPFAFFVYLWPGALAAMLMQTGTTILMHMWMGPIYGTVQGLAGANRRATAAAFNMLAVNLIGYGMGPLLVGLASDFFSARVGQQSLRYSLLAVVVVSYSWAAVHFFLAAKTLRQDLVRAETDTSFTS